MNAARVTAVARALAAALVVAAVVVGGPLALVRFGRLGALLGFDWGAVWVTRDDGSLVLGVITLVGWGAWALATLSLISEVVAVATRERHRPRLPGAGLFAPASAVLVTAIIGLVAGQVIVPARAHAQDPADDAGTPAATTVASAAARPSEASDPMRNPTTRTHLVQPGDDLWSLAERYFGDGTRWRQIAEVNDTVLIEGTDLLQPGMVLAIPAGVADPPDDGAVTVQSGDTLSGLAETYLGEAGRWPELAAVNGDQVLDPDRIDTGWQLRLPEDTATDGPDEEQAAPESRYAPTDDGEPVEQCPVPVDPASAPDGPVIEVSSPEAGADLLPAVAATAAIGSVLAGGLIGQFRWRRRQQQASRPLGRRLPPIPPGSEPIRGALEQLAASADPVTSSATVVELGERPGGGPDGVVRSDLEGSVVTAVLGDDGDDIAMASAIALQLACTGDGNTAVIAAGAEFGWMTSLDEPRVVIRENIDDGMRELGACVARRLASLPPGATAAGLRSDPQLAEAWAPQVFIFATPPGSPLPAGMREAGVACVVCGEVPGAGTVVSIGDDLAECLGVVGRFSPRLVPPPARRALAEIFEAANASELPPAPWWSETSGTEEPTPLPLPIAHRPGDLEESSVSPLAESSHPVLHLLGPVRLTGTRGPLPARAVKQCQEYCAWLLEHPGSSAPAMTQSLLVAEGTRRSNMSRLRAWLGSAPDGTAYLPDAYSGRISLHPAVTSDWETLQLLVGGGVNRTGDAALVQALSVVRGAPLADAAPGQWHWAEQLRADMTALVRDIGVVLARHAMASGDSDLAAWAVERAQLAAPDDELLLGLRIRMADAAGDRAEVDHLVMHLTRRARTLGVDLADETVVLLQQVVEGRARLRA
ncbi:hypothetical protein GCM10009785_09890 [Brooklawnia cerclae]|uniref:LysM repeat protein n=1 Tax=Brooklawnia cerclae TaxID=349934 RepID=A0ABX0SI54_9ACTN|nr:LysM repeat protein [Brooklawnia cerclae]